ncbi:hypothetical protein [Allomuricauda sp. ARW1Y1]|jgi:hypothetical protein|uniref:hypothetical protein n=1 Tax=Allomuricauda sp. ARW1Y1 TaxID=2663843 RepID=UPI0015C7169C|nr:hypothetical protein [Muricauda sp. ARW1Y1]NYJ26334.1 hypothetical protein [Muricauda sp. ARW1Y1]
MGKIKIDTIEELEAFLQENPVTKKQVIAIVNTALGVFMDGEFSSNKVPTKEEKALLMKRVRSFVDEWPMEPGRERPLFIN